MSKEKMIPLTLSKRPSIFNGKVFQEHVDVNLLHTLIESNYLKKTCSTRGMDKSYHENEKTQLTEYMKLYNSSKESFLVNYNQVSCNWGRVLPYRSLSLGSFRKEIRHTLCSDSYIDIDIVNCHPVILKQICDFHDIPCPCLSQYVSERDSLLFDVMTQYNVSRDDAKELFIRILYFGKFETWGDDIIQQGLSNAPLSSWVILPFIKQFSEEMKQIAEIILRANPLMIEDIQTMKDEQGKKCTNPIGTGLSYYLQEIERRVLEKIYRFFKDNKCLKDDACVPCADGIMIRTTNFNKRGAKFKSLYLLHLKDFIHEQTGFDLQFITKEMTLSLKDNLSNPSTFDVDTFIENSVKDKLDTLLTFKLPDFIHHRVYTEEYCQPFDALKSHNILVCQEPMMAGKSEQGIHIIKSDDIFNPLNSDDFHKRILFLVNRKKLGSDLQSRYSESGIPILLDIPPIQSINNMKFLAVAICAESLHKVSFVPDLLVLDECTSLLCQFNSGLHKEFLIPNRDKFDFLIQHTPKILCMDADVDQRIFNILHSLRPSEKIFFQQNLMSQGLLKAKRNYPLDPENNIDEWIRCDGHREGFTKLFFDMVDSGKKIYAVLSSENEGLILEKLLNEKNIKNRFYHSEGPDYKEDFLDFNKAVQNFQVVMATSTISSGVNIKVKYFHCEFFFGLADSVSVREGFQMAHRVRDTIDKKIYYHLKARSNSEDRLPILLSSIQQHFEDNFNDRKNLWKLYLSPIDKQLTNQNMLIVEKLKQNHWTMNSMLVLQERNISCVFYKSLFKLTLEKLQYKMSSLSVFLDLPVLYDLAEKNQAIREKIHQDTIVKFDDIQHLSKTLFDQSFRKVNSSIASDSDKMYVKKYTFVKLFKQSYRQEISLNLFGDSNNAISVRLTPKLVPEEISGDVYTNLLPHMKQLFNASDELYSHTLTPFHIQLKNDLKKISETPFHVRILQYHDMKLLCEILNIPSTIDRNCILSKKFFIQKKEDLRPLWIGLTRHFGIRGTANIDDFNSMIKTLQSVFKKWSGSFLFCIEKKRETNTSSSSGVKKRTEDIQYLYKLLPPCDSFDKYVHLLKKTSQTDFPDNSQSDMDLSQIESESTDILHIQPYNPPTLNDSPSLRFSLDVFNFHLFKLYDSYSLFDLQELEKIISDQIHRLQNSISLYRTEINSLSVDESHPSFEKYSRSKSLREKFISIDESHLLQHNSSLLQIRDNISSYPIRVSLNPLLDTRISSLPSISNPSPITGVIPQDGDAERPTPIWSLPKKERQDFLDIFEQMGGSWSIDGQDFITLKEKKRLDHEKTKKKHH